MGDATSRLYSTHPALSEIEVNRDERISETLINGIRTGGYEVGDYRGRRITDEQELKRRRNRITILKDYEAPERSFLDTMLDIIRGRRGRHVFLGSLNYFYTQTHYPGGMGVQIWNLDIYDHYQIPEMQNLADRLRDKKVCIRVRSNP